MKARLLTAALGLMLAGSLATGADNPQAKRQDIRRMMELSGAGQIGMQVMNQLVAIYKQSNTGVPEKFWIDFMASVDPNEIVGMVVPIYDRYFSHDEIRQMIAFFQSPIGRKMVSVQPNIVQESMQAGQAWGERLGERVMKMLKEKGYK